MTGPAVKPMPDAWGGSPRTKRLAKLDSYYNGCQYSDRAAPWDQVLDERTQKPVPFRSRRPSIVLPLCRLIVDTLTRHLFGAGKEPKPLLEGQAGEDEAALLTEIATAPRVAKAVREATRRAITIGTGLLTWRVQGGRFHVEAWDAAYATPTFKPGAYPILETLDYRIPFDAEVSDGKGGLRTARFWKRQLVTETEWTVFDSAEVIGDNEPAWQKDSALSVRHDLQFVPAVWMPIGERDGIDGTSVFASLLSVFDELNYVASQASRSLFQNLDPQTVFSGVSDADVPTLKGGGNTWALGKDGKAYLLESSGGHVEQATARMEELRRWALDATGVIVADPERTVGAASGAALELLHLPMIQAVEDLRVDVGEGFRALLQQMLYAAGVKGGSQGRRVVGAELPVGEDWAAVPVSLAWPPHFPSVPADALAATQAATAAVGQGLISRAAGARYLGAFYNVDDTEADAVEIEKDENRQDARVAATTKNSDIGLGLDEEPAVVPPRNGKGATVTKETT